MSGSGSVLFDSIAKLGADATLHRYAGYVSTGGHHYDVFEAGETVRVVIRPWQSDMSRTIPEGSTGQTPGVKVYAPESLGLTREDRLVYRDGHFRLMNPQYDQTNSLERWDGQTDEREFRLLSELDPDVADTLVGPEADTYGGQ